MDDTTRSITSGLRQLLELPASPSEDRRGTGGPRGEVNESGSPKRSRKKNKDRPDSQQQNRDSGTSAPIKPGGTPGGGPDGTGRGLSGPTQILERAIAVLDELGSKFVSLREDDRAKAYLYFQRALMSNLGTLSPIIPAKDIVALSMDIEHYLKGITSSSGIAPEKQMQEFLMSVGEYAAA